MKETLRKRLEDVISRIDARCEQLRKKVLEYKEDNEYESAVKYR
ncbi:hypothetical protein OAE07_02615 [Winogradskyella sp.]|nr:hypothetical protein [Winogradskyella sp.]MDC1505026.1 hypothetical protein [Winogradskyella sp.]